MNAAAGDPANIRTHPQTGVVSVGLAVLTGAVTIVLLAVSFAMKSGTYADRRWTNVLLVYGAGIAPLLHFAGLVLGIVGAFTKNSKKAFPALGIILNGLPLLIAAVVWALLFWIIWAVLASGGGWM